MDDSEMTVSALYLRHLDGVATRGNYDAQRQLDFRLEPAQTLRIVSYLIQGGVLQSNEALDFQIAMGRRDEPEGSSLKQVGAKYGL